jgi:hypothetical protein
MPRDHAAMGDEEKILTAINALDPIIRRWQPKLQAEASFDALPRVLAAGALARSAAILRSARALLQAGELEGIGYLVRGAWETSLVGMYVLVDGFRGVLRLNADQARQELALTRANDVEPEVIAILDDRMSDLVANERRRRAAAGDQEGADAFTKFERLKVADLARVLGPQLVEHGFEEDADAAAAYDLLYRSHSTYDTHGLAAIERHVRFGSDGRLGIKADPDGWIDAHRATALVTLYVGLLAKYVLRTFGLPDGEAEATAVLDELHGLLDSLKQ